jgi:hypothetical protein
MWRPEVRVAAPRRIRSLLLTSVFTGPTLDNERKDMPVRDDWVYGRRMLYELMASLQQKRLRGLLYS